MVMPIEMMKFEAQSLEAVVKEYQRVQDERRTRLHLSHVPVIDKDHPRVDD
ncbi:MAG: hypothetical protein M0Z50_04955 [Planctomycetia bacterium]|nr:hypothetical protein [Planctomycetia bacterium]